MKIKPNWGKCPLSAIQPITGICHSYTSSVRTISSARLRMLFIRRKIPTLKKSKLSRRYANKHGILRKKSLDFFFQVFYFFSPQKSVSVPFLFFHFLGTAFWFSSSNVASAFILSSVVMSRYRIVVSNCL